MRTVSILTAAAAALISTMGMAAEPAQKSFTRNGHTYVYSTTARDGGRTLIEGREVGSASRFRLLVDGNRVTGHANGYPVSFRTQTPLTAVASAN
jgi:hypothetical protein